MKKDTKILVKAAKDAKRIREQQKKTKQFNKRISKASRR